MERYLNHDFFHSLPFLLFILNGRTNTKWKVHSVGADAFVLDAAKYKCSPGTVLNHFYEYGPMVR